MTVDLNSGKVVVEVNESQLSDDVAQQLQDAITMLTTENRRHIVIDLLDCQRADDDALTSLIACARRIRALHGSLSLVTDDHTVLAALHSTGVDTLLPVHNDRATALGQ